MFRPAAGAYLSPTNNNSRVMTSNAATTLSSGFCLVYISLLLLSIGLPLIWILVSRTIEFALKHSFSIVRVIERHTRTVFDICQTIIIVSSLVGCSLPLFAACNLFRVIQGTVHKVVLVLITCFILIGIAMCGWLGNFALEHGFSGAEGEIVSHLRVLLKSGRDFPSSESERTIEPLGLLTTSIVNNDLMEDFTEDESTTQEEDFLQDECLSRDEIFESEQSQSELDGEWLGVADGDHTPNLYSEKNSAMSETW